MIRFTELKVGDYFKCPCCKCKGKVLTKEGGSITYWDDGIQKQGYPPYFLLEVYEENEFKARFL
jgi:hypothetical protein